MLFFLSYLLFIYVFVLMEKALVSAGEVLPVKNTWIIQSYQNISKIPERIGAKPIIG